jgi:hypothetical protein
VGAFVCSESAAHGPQPNNHLQGEDFSSIDERLRGSQFADESDVQHWFIAG